MQKWDVLSQAGRTNKMSQSYGRVFAFDATQRIPESPEYLVSAPPGRPRYRPYGVLDNKRTGIHGWLVKRSCLRPCRVLYPIDWPQSQDDTRGFYDNNNNRNSPKTRFGSMQHACCWGGL